MLVITLYPGGDDTFRVGDTKVRLMDAAHELRFRLRVFGDCIDKDYWVTDRSMVEILPNVKVMAGHKASPGSVKVSIDAPPAIRIDRESVYQRKKSGGAEK